MGVPLVRGKKFRFRGVNALGLFFAVFSVTLILGVLLQFYLLPQIFPPCTGATAC